MLSTRKKTPSAGNPVSGMRVHVVSWQSSWPQSHNSLASVTDVRSGRLTGNFRHTIRTQLTTIPQYSYGFQTLSV
jgi:hypothetical protein